MDDDDLTDGMEDNDSFHVFVLRLLRVLLLRLLLAEEANFAPAATAAAAKLE